MAGLRGYYSVIQYCPDASRGEVANVGVVLFCPDCGFLEAKVAEGNDRIARFFGRSSFDPDCVNDAKHAIITRLDVERDRFRTSEDLSQFAQTRANEIVLTLPRPMKVENPVVELEELYNELVGGRQIRTPRAHRNLGQQLRAIFERPAIRDKVLREEEVLIPITNTLLKVPYAFQNGTLNLVRPLTLTRSTVVEAHQLAVDGDLLRRHASKMAQPATLLIALAAPDTPERRSIRDTAEKLFHEYALNTYREEQIEKLEEYVEAVLY